MSGKVSGWIWDSDIQDKSEKFTLLAYADHASHDGTGIYPSVPLVAWKTGYSERHVKRVKQILIEKGYLVPDNSVSEKYGTPVFRIVEDALPKRPPWLRGDPGRPEKKGGDIHDNRVTHESPYLEKGGDIYDTKTEKGVTSTTKGGDTGVTLTVIETSLKDKQEIFPLSDDDKDFINELEAEEPPAQSAKAGKKITAESLLAAVAKQNEQLAKDPKDDDVSVQLVRHGHLVDPGCQARYLALIDSAKNDLPNCSLKQRMIICAFIAITDIKPLTKGEGKKAKDTMTRWRADATHFLDNYESIKQIVYLMMAAENIRQTEDGPAYTIKGLSGLETDMQKELARVIKEYRLDKQPATYEVTLGEQ